MNFVTRRKSIDALGESARKLKPTLSWPHLMALGVGATVMCVLLFRTRLIPRWLAISGLIARK